MASCHLGVEFDTPARSAVFLPILNWGPPLSELRHQPFCANEITMLFVALAVDYDGTLAHNGRVDDAGIAALEKVKRSGRKVLLVTGRELADLQQTFSRIEIFDLIVAENGALLFDPAQNKEELLSHPPADRLVTHLRDREVAPLSVGRSIVATWEPHETTVL